MPSVKYAPIPDESTAALAARARPRILLSHWLTLMGSRAWEFATPLLLLGWTFGGRDDDASAATSLLAPALFGLVTTASGLILNPPLGAAADREHSRMKVVTIAASAQALGTAGAERG